MESWRAIKRTNFQPQRLPSKIKNHSSSLKIFAFIRHRSYAFPSFSPRARELSYFFIDSNKALFLSTPNPRIRPVAKCPCRPPAPVPTAFPIPVARFQTRTRCAELSPRRASGGRQGFCEDLQEKAFIVCVGQDAQLLRTWRGLGGVVCKY